MCVWPPPPANAGGWIARSQTAGPRPPGPQADSHSPRPREPERAGIPGLPADARDPLGTSGLAKSNRQNRSGSTRLARRRGGWGTRYPHLAEASLCQFARLEVGQGLHRLGARPRTETGGMGLFACQPIRGTPPPARLLDSGPANGTHRHLSCADFVPADAARHQQGPLACKLQSAP